MIRRRVRDTRFCMPMKENQRRCLSFFQKGRTERTAMSRSTVMGWWMVATVGIFFGDGPDAVREALVVVNDVIALHPVSQKPLGADAEGKGLGKPHGRNTRPFHDIDRVGQLLEGGNPEQMLRIVQVQTGQPVDGDVRVQAGIRRAGNHFDMVADIFQCPAQVFQVDTLATAVGVAPVAQQTDVKGDDSRLLFMIIKQAILPDWQNRTTYSPGRGQRQAFS